MAGKRRKIWKIIGISLLTLLGLLLTSLIILFIFIEDIVEARIKDLLEKRFEGFYAMTWESIDKDIGWSKMTFVVHEAEFTSDTTHVDNVEDFPVVFFKTRELRIQNVSTWDILWGKKIDLELVELVKPDFSFYSKHKKRVDEEKSEKRRALSQMNLGQFSLINGRLEIYDFETKKRLLINDSITVRVDDIEMDLNRLDDFGNSFEISDFYVESFRSELTPIKGFYEFGLDSLRLYGKDGRLEFKNIDIRTKMTLEEISKTKINFPEVIKAYVGEVLVEGVNYEKLIQRDQLEVRKLSIEDAQIEIFKNKLTQLEASFKKKVLNEIFRGLKYPIRLDTIALKNMSLIFELMASSEKEPAHITLDSVNGYFSNFNSDPRSQDTLHASIDGIFLKKGEMHLDLDIAVHDTLDNYQKFRGYLQSMPFSALNQTIQNFVNIRIVKGWIDRLDFAGYTNEHKSWGTVAFRYHDLQMDIYSFKDKSEKKKNGFLTGVAKMAIHKTNPLPNGDLRTASFNYERERWEGSVMLWLGGTLKGVLKTTLKDFVLDILKDQGQKKIKKEKRELKKRRKAYEKEQNQKNE